MYQLFLRRYYPVQHLLLNKLSEKGLKTKAEFGINPGSEQVRYTVDRDGYLDTFEKMGATVFTNACGPCIGMWDRVGAEKQEKNTIVHSFNRNFAKRADGNPNTHAFVASPEMVTAMAIAGDLSFNPLTDTLTNEKGEQVKLDPPTGYELPLKGFAVEDAGYQAPAEDGQQCTGYGFSNISPFTITGSIYSLGKAQTLKV